jgi:hypothetical protein
MAPRPDSGSFLVLEEAEAALPPAGPATEFVSPVRLREDGKIGLRISRMAL